MKYYESVIILDPTLTMTETKEKVLTYEEILQKFSTKKKVAMEELGKKQLAYEIKGHKTGYYVIFHFHAEVPEDIAELERLFRIDDDVLKFITIRASSDDTHFSLEDLPKDGSRSKDLPQKVNKYKDIDALDVLLGRVKI